MTGCGESQASTALDMPGMAPKYRAEVGALSDFVVAPALRCGPLHRTDVPAEPPLRVLISLRCQKAAPAPLPRLMRQEAPGPLNGVLIAYVVVVVVWLQAVGPTAKVSGGYCGTATSMAAPVATAMSLTEICRS